jgi:hypothetical protein
MWTYNYASEKLHIVEAMPMALFVHERWRIPEIKCFNKK